MANYTKFVTKNIRTNWVKQWCSDFLAHLDKISEQGRNNIEEYCQTKKNDFIEECKTRSKGTSEHSWKNSAASNMSGIRKAILQWQETAKLSDGNSYEQPLEDGSLKRQHVALAIMNFPKNFHRERETDIKARKKQQREKLVNITDIDTFQEMIDKLLISKDFKEIAVGLIAATGRRPSEILSTAEFKQVGKFEVNFAGQLKTKEGKTYTPYTLVESHKVCDALLRLRRMPEIKELKKRTLAEIDSGKNSGINRVVVEYFGEILNPPTGEVSLSAKNLRAAYAAISIYLFCPWTTDPSLFVTENLGHANDSIQSNYRDYEVTDIGGKPLTRGAWVNRLNEEMEETMQTETQARIRVSKEVREAIDDKEFLPYPDQVSRMEELVRLAKIGKQFEEGKLVKEVVKVVEKPVTQRLEEMSNEELLGANIPNSGAEKIRRAVAAIKTYNERQAENKYKWSINSKVLKDLTNCRTEAVSRFLDSEEGRLQVKDYNEMHQLGFHHNRGKGSIKDVVKLA